MVDGERALDLRAVLRPLRPLVERPPAARRRPRRPGSLHRPEHPCAARGVLRRSPNSAPSSCRSTTASCPPTGSTWSTTRGSRVLCVHSATISTWSTASAHEMPAVEHFVALEGERRGLARVRAPPRRGDARLRSARDRRGRPARDQLHERHHGEAQGRDDHPPQRLDERRRHAGPPPDDAAPTATCGRCRCSTPMDGRSSGSSPRPAARTSACARWTPPPCTTFSRGERITMLCAAPTVLISIANAPRRTARRRRRGACACSPPARRRPPHTIERVEDGLGWTITQVYGLTETAPFITICEPRPEHAALSPRERARDQGAPGRRADHFRRAAGGGRATARTCRATATRSARSWRAATW